MKRKPSQSTIVQAPLAQMASLVSPIVQPPVAQTAPPVAAIVRQPGAQILLDCHPQMLSQ
jgi:hypothetical protein